MVPLGLAKLALEYFEPSGPGGFWRPHREQLRRQCLAAEIEHRVGFAGAILALQGLSCSNEETPNHVPARHSAEGEDRANTRRLVFGLGVVAYECQGWVGVTATGIAETKLGSFVVYDGAIFVPYWHKLEEVIVGCRGNNGCSAIRMAQDSSEPDGGYAGGYKSSTS